MPCCKRAVAAAKTHVAVPFKVNARALKEVDRVARVEVHEDVKVEVELPAARPRRFVAVLVKERHAQLDQFEAEARWERGKQGA